MKKYTSLARKGFTLVELMIVIAIIGILAAVLYPAMTGYFERSRDTNRQGALRNLTLSLSAYNMDKAEYPAAATNKCVDDLSALVGPYIQKLPQDPKGNYGVVGCETKGSPKKSGYGYQLVADANGTANSSYIIAAKMENTANANFDANNWGTTSTGSPTSSTLQIGTGALANVNNKTGSGTYFVVGQ